MEIKSEKQAKKKLLLIGGGGHCRVVLDSVINGALYDELGYDELGIVDYVQHSYFGVSVIGTDEDIPELIKDGWTHAMITVGSIGTDERRRKLYELAKKNGLIIATVIDPTAVVASDVMVKEGSYVGKRAILNSGTTVGLCSIINTGAIVEHECQIGEFAHVSPGSILCGQVEIGKGTHVGAGSVVKQQIRIGEHSMIGAGSVVVDDIPERVCAFGNPCRVVKLWES